MTNEEMQKIRVWMKHKDVERALQELERAQVEIERLQKEVDEFEDVKAQKNILLHQNEIYKTERERYRKALKSIAQAEGSAISILLIEHAQQALKGE